MFYSPAPVGRARRARDFWPTPPEIARALIVGLDRLGLGLPAPVYDPCVGNGKLLAALGVAGFGSDLFPDEYPRSALIETNPVDAGDPEALAELLGSSRSLITNPPYGHEAARVARACLKLLEARSVELAALLLPLPWEAAGSPERLKLVRHPLMRGRIVCCWRPEWIEGTGGGGKMNFAWLVWAARERETPGPRAPASVYVSRADAA